MSTLPAAVYGSEEDVCTFGAECQLSRECVDTSPALERLSTKYVFPMREHHTQVFFDNSMDNQRTLAIVFAEDRHGLVLDIISVLKALGIRVHRVANGENDAVRLLMHRIEGELISLRGLNLSLTNCVAFWMSEEDTGDKIFDDGHRLAQIAECIKIELNTPYPRPRPGDAGGWHRISVQKNRADRYTVFSLQTDDRPGLLAEVTASLSDIAVDIASASINTLSKRVENHFFVTKRGFKEPLAPHDVNLSLKAILKSLIMVGNHSEHETLWYQKRDGTDCLIAEAIFIDEVNNHERACLKFSKFETPNFRGRLPEVPYRPLSLE